MTDYNVTVGVDVQDQQLDALEARIKALNNTKINIDTNKLDKQIDIKPKKVKMEVDVDVDGISKKLKPVETRIRNLNDGGKKKLTGHTTSLNSFGAGKQVNGVSKQVKDVEGDFNKLLGLQSKIKNMRFKLSGLDAGKDTDQIAKLESVIGKAQKSYNDLYRSVSRKLDTNQIKRLNDEFDANVPATKQAVDSYRQLGRMLKEINSISKAASKLTPTSNINEYDLLNNRLNTLKKNYSELRSSLRGQMSSGQLSSLNDEISKADHALSRLKSQMRDTLDSKIKTGGFDSDITKINSKMRDLRTVTDDIKEGRRNLDKLARQAVAAMDSGDIDKAIAKHKEYEQTLKKLNNQIDTQKKKQSMEADPAKVSKLDYDIEKALKSYTAAGAEFESQLKSIQTRLKTCNATELSGLKNEFDQVIRSADLAGKTTMSFKDRLSTQFGRYVGYFSVASVFMELAQGVRYMFDSVLSVDTAMTELYRVTDLTSAQYSGLYDNMISSAQEYGSTLTDMISSTAAWSRLGYSANEALGLAEVSAMYQHISDLDYDAAVENLVTGYKGFQTELSTMFDGDSVAAVEYVGDVYNELGNNYAITSGQVGDSLTRAASALSLAGNTFTESAAMVTGVTEVTQDPEKAGSAMKILSLRLRGMKGELEEVEAGASEGVESVSKMQTQILNMTGGKVNIFDKDGSFRSTYDIMNDIADVYDDLTDPEKADLLETIAGKNRANDVAALINNWERVEQANESGMNAAGSAAREHEAYLDSLQGRIDSLKGTFEAFSVTVLESDFLKGLISGTENFLGVLNTLFDKLGTLPILLGTVSGAMAVFKNSGWFFNSVNQGKSNNLLNLISTRQGARLSELASAVTTGYSEKRGIAGVVQGIGNGINANRNKITRSDISKLQKYNDALRTGMNSQSAYYKHLSGASMAAKDAATNARGAMVNIDKLSASAKKGGIAMSVLSKGLSLVGNIGATMLVTMAISAAISGITKLINAKKDLAKEIDDVTTSYNNSHKSLIENRSEFENQAKRYTELASGVYKNTGMNKSLTSSEYEEYQQVVNSIAESTPSLVKGFDAQGNAILNCANDVEALNDAYDQLIIDENNKLLNGDGEDYKGVSEISKDLRNAYSEYKSWTGKFDDQNTNFEMKDMLESILDSENIDVNAVSDIVGNADSAIAKALKKELESSGEEIDIEFPTNSDGYNEYIAEVCKSHPKVARAIIDDFNSSFDEEVAPMRTAMQAHLENAFLGEKYENLVDDDDIQGIASQLVNGLDSTFIAELNESGGSEAVLDYVDSLLNSINNFDPEQMKKFKDGFNLLDEFTEGEMSYGDYIADLNELENFLLESGLDEEMVTQIKVSMNMDEAQEEYDALINRLTTEFDDETLGKGLASAFVDNLDSYELTAFEDLLEKGKIDFSGAKAGFDELEKYGMESLQTTFGNINLNNRQEFDWTRENLDKYSSVVKSWDDKPEDLINTTSTIMGAWDTWDINGKEVDIAFSPMLQTENGAIPLSKEESHNYIDKLVDKALEDGEWNEEELLELDSKGIEVGGKKINGLLADIGDTAKQTSEVMHTVTDVLDEVNGAYDIVEEHAKYLKAMDFEIPLEAETTAIETLGAALTEVRSGSGLTLESFEAIKSLYSDVDGYDAATLFEETAHGINLNNEALNELESNRVNDTIEETQGNIDTLKKKYGELTRQIENADDAAKAELVSERESVRQKIIDLAEQATILEGMNSDYAQWQRAEESGNDRDMYQNVYSAMEGVQKELENGWIDAGTQEYFDLIFGDSWDKAGKGIQDYRDKWATLGETIEGTSYSINDFFKVNEEGELTSEGIWNFFDAVDEAEGKIGRDVVKKDADGNIVSFDFGVDGDKAIAEALGISEEMVQIFIRASRDMGFVVDMDGNYTQLANLQNEALAAQDALNALATNENEEYKIDFETTNIEDLQSSIDKLKNDARGFWDKDGNFNEDVAGADHAMKMASSLQASIDSANDKYIGLTVEDATFEEPLSKLQDYEAKVNAINQLKLNPEVYAGDIEKLEKDLDGIVDYFDDIKDDEQFKDLGIADLSREQIAEKVANGEITIPTTLDVQMDMSESLNNIEDAALLLYGTLTGELTDEQIHELRVRLGLEVEEDEDAEEKGQEAGKESAESAKKGAEEGAKEVEEDGGTKYEPHTAGHRKGVEYEGNATYDHVETSARVVRYHALVDTSAIEDATPEDVEVMVKYLKGEELEEGEKEVLARLNLDTSEIDSWTPEEKESYVRFLVESGLIDGYTVDPKTGEVIYEGDTSNLPDSEEISNETGTVEVEYISKGEEWRESLGITDRVIEYTTSVDTSAIEDATPEDVEVMVKYLNEGSEALTDEEKEVLARLNLDTSEIDSWTPEEKQAFVKFLAETGLIDGLTIDPKTGEVIYSGDYSGTGSAPLKNGTASYSGDYSGTGSAPLKNGIAGYMGDFSGVGEAPGKNGIARYTGDFSGVGSAPTLTGVINYVKNIIGGDEGGGGVDGTAHAKGTAYSNGTSRRKRSSDSDIESANKKANKKRFIKRKKEVEKINEEVSKENTKKKKKIEKSIEANNRKTINKNGKAFSQGDWGTKDSGVALVGELGEELLVRDGRWYTIGSESAEFVGYKKGDIIFNAEQTKQIFEKGKITHGNGRGKALASGTAFSSGTTGGNKKRPTYGVSYSASDSSSSGGGGGGGGGSSSGSGSGGGSDSSSSDDSKEEFEETIDWIEKAIDRIERVIDQLDTKVESTYRSWSERNTSIYDEIGKITDELEMQQKAYDRYIKEADSVGLDSKYAEMVRDGTIDIETITDEDLNEKIGEYSEWYEKALDCKDAILELQEAQSELYETAFEHVATEYEGYLAVIEHEKTMLEEFINQSEERGWIVSTEYYNALIGNQEETIEELKKERAELTKKMDEAVNDGAIIRGSEAWYEMVQEIDDITASIEEGNTALIEYANNIRDIEWEVFDFLQDQISNITTEAEFLIDLMSNKKLYEDNGQLTDEGMATMGVHGMNYNVHMYQADMYGDEVENLDKQIAEDPYDQELLDRRQELLELQQESIIAAEEEKNAIKDMVEEGINLELESLEELIDKYLDALDAEKDLYDYQRKVKEQAKEIASLEKQMSAFEGDDSEEAKQKIQELKVSLEEAEADLEETEYDKYINDQQELLDELYLEYETILNERLDNIDALVADMIEQINANAAGINTTITEQANAVGYNLSNEMKNIWGTGGISGVISAYGDKFDEKFTTTITTLKYLHANVQKMIGQLNKLAKTNVKAAGESSAAKKKTTTTTTTTKKEEPKKETKKATDDQMMGIAASIWVYGDSSGWGNDPVRSGRVTEKFDAATAKEVQSLINKHGPNGDLYNFWVKKGYNLDKYKYSAFKSGVKDIDETQLAWTQEGRQKEFIIRPSDGAILTPLAKGDSVLNATASKNIWDMANDPSGFIKDSLDIGNVDVPSGGANNNTYVQNLDKVVFNLPNISNYSEFVRELQHDKSFEKLVKSMTIDRLAGGSSLAKTKSIR